MWLLIYTTAPTISTRFFLMIMWILGFFIYASSQNGNGLPSNPLIRMCGRRNCQPQSQIHQRPPTSCRRQLMPTIFRNWLRIRLLQLGFDYVYFFLDRHIINDLKSFLFVIKSIARIVGVPKPHRNYANSVAFISFYLKCLSVIIVSYSKFC